MGLRPRLSLAAALPLKTMLAPATNCERIMHTILIQLNQVLRAAPSFLPVL